MTALYGEIPGSVNPDVTFDSIIEWTTAFFLWLLGKAAP
jgi:hypothetical protein